MFIKKSYVNIKDIFTSAKKVLNKELIKWINNMKTTTAVAIIWIVLILFLAGLVLYNIFHDIMEE